MSRSLIVSFPPEKTIADVLPVISAKELFPVTVRVPVESKLTMDEPPLTAETLILLSVHEIEPSTIIMDCVTLMLRNVLPPETSSEFVLLQ